eukprot:CAMPEP_0182429438 /NCGR_PEP_ID=MMETSP1167-20130531/28902_1 /TAXON_ID=2988 /ORGANISM="Mallomonas Sp, Strain CCMP3275" /LENGTH=259 /DNA_ID=CAMNT_0024613141 /DNA_START=207 /DNA_END=986 /DNA_ORIENTATION=+
MIQHGDADSKAVRKNKYLKEVLKLKSTIPHWNDLFGESADDSRLDEWVRIEVLGEPLAKKYAWAIPDERALTILSNFSPLVEVGCGKGYWCSLLRERKVDILSYDQFIQKSSWISVLKGGPKCLLNQPNKDRNLFLCYPDETSNVGYRCLHHFSGQYVIHVGELIHTGTYNGSDQSPWGRTSSSDFQVKLSQLFHCLLYVRLPSFPFSNDYLSVWKRSRVISADNNESEEEQEPDLWRHIPPDERLPDVCAPCLQHLLK